MEAGYSGTARELSERLGRRVRRQNIDEWNKRRVLNGHGQPFPLPVREEPAPKRTQPRLIFDVEEVEAWARGGVPGRNGQGFVHIGWPGWARQE